MIVTWCGVFLQSYWPVQHCQLIHTHTHIYIHGHVQYKMSINVGRINMAISLKIDSMSAICSYMSLSMHRRIDWFYNQRNCQTESANKDLPKWSKWQNFYSLMTHFFSVSSLSLAALAACAGRPSWGSADGSWGSNSTNGCPVHWWGRNC